MHIFLRWLPEIFFIEDLPDMMASYKQEQFQHGPVKTKTNNKIWVTFQCSLLFTHYVMSVPIPMGEPLKAAKISASAHLLFFVAATT